MVNSSKGFLFTFHTSVNIPFLYITEGKWLVNNANVR